MKREKRRLDDLLTIREGEVAQMRERLREEANKREKQEAEATTRVLRVERDFQKQIAKVREEASSKAKTLGLTTAISTAG